jgi:hypothetical protein
MGYFRFRRSIRLFPGVRLNIGKTGVSTSLGVRGAHITVGHGKVRTTVGLPGTGLSYTDVQDAGETDTKATQRPVELPPEAKGTSAWVWVVVLLLVVLLVRLFTRRSWS